jgi:hypothetical protein
MGEKDMPRLVGKQSNNGALVSLLLIAAIAAAIGLEYKGAIDIVPGFGRTTQDFKNDSRNAF